MKPEAGSKPSRGRSKCPTPERCGSADHEECRAQSKCTSLARPRQRKQKSAEGKTTVKNQCPTPAAGNPEGPRACWVSDTQDDNTTADQDEREQGADISQVNHLVDASDGGKAGDEDTSHNRGDIGCAKARVNGAKDWRQQPIARH